MKGTCKICGCTETNACNHIDYGSCWWVDDTQEICSHCSIEEIRNSTGVEKPKKSTLKSLKPKLFNPTKADTLKALNTVAQHLSDDKVISSPNHLDLKVRGKRKS